MTDIATGSGTNDNDEVIEITDLDNHDTFMLTSAAGAMDVFADLDGSGYSANPLALVDLGNATTTPVLVTAAGNVYGFRGKFQKIRVLQNGATGVTSAKLRYGKM